MAAHTAGTAFVRGFADKCAELGVPPRALARLAKLAAAVPPAPAASTAPIPAVGFTLEGYDGATRPAGTYDRNGAAAASGLGPLRDATPATVASQQKSVQSVPALQAAGTYAAGAINHLAGLPEFQRRVGGGDVALGRERVSTAARDLAALPVVNEEAAKGVATTYTRPGTGSYMQMPASNVGKHRTYRATGAWLDGLMSHEMFHPFTIKLPGYLDRIKAIQAEEGVSGASYYKSPREQAAELNAIRALKGAWPGAGAGEGGKYTPEQADEILDGENPYFEGLPVNYKMRLLNEVRNEWLRRHRYGVAQRHAV